MEVPEIELKLDIPNNLKIPFAVINKLGLFSDNKCKKVSLAMIYSLLPIITMTAALLQFINMKADISEFVSNLEAISGFVQLLGKIIIVASRQKDFVKVIATTKEFWNVNDCEESIREELKLISYMTRRIQRLFIPLLLIAVAFVILSPLFGKALPLGIWTLEGHDILYRIILFVQPPTVTFSAILISSFDCMYLALCAELIIQFRILCHNLERLTTIDAHSQEMEINQFRKMKTCLQQHIFLLRFIKNFQDLYSSALLIEYLTAGPLICAELYAAFESRSFQLQFRHVIIFLLISTQLSFFCIPVNYIANEALLVSDAAYFSNWYSQYSPSLETPLLLMIQNAQQEVTIKAGGLVTINATTVLNILKVAWSACSIMRGLK